MAARLVLVLSRHESATPVVLDYSAGYAAWLAVCALLALGGIFLLLRPGFRELVAGERFRPKATLLAVWLPGVAIAYGVGYVLSPDKPLWNDAFGRLAWLGTLAVLIATWDALPDVLRKPQFWMALVSTLVSLGVLEMGMRYWARHVAEDWQRMLYDPAAVDLNATPRYEPHPYEGYIPRKNWTAPAADGEDRINSRGFRGPEIPVPKAEGTYRIVAVGGSTTFGTQVRNWYEAYPAQLESVLRDEYGYGNVEVINGGVGGHNSWETLVSLEFRVLDLDPDLIVLYQNTNDVHARLVPPGVYAGDDSGRRKMWDLRDTISWQMRVPSALWRFAAIGFGWMEDSGGLSLDSIVSRPCSGTHADEQCLGMTPAEALRSNPPVYYERNIRNMIAVARANGVDFLIVSWASNPGVGDYASRPEYQAAYAEQNAIAARIAEDTHSRFYDLAAAMPLDPEYWADGRHMTAAGNRVRAELIAAYLVAAGVLPQPRS